MDTIDPLILTRAFLGMYNWTYQWYRPEGPISVEEVHEGYAAIFLEGITTERARAYQVGCDASVER